MRFDIFLSICQTPVDGFLPSERQMLTQFFDQVDLADQLGFGCAWVAETHLSCQIQKQNPGAVIPHFEGEIGLNTDVLQLATRIFARTKQIHVGSAIRNILCNGGPVAHAENIRMFLSLHGMEAQEKRLLEIGFAAGRFPFSNQPYGIIPRTPTEKAAWPIVKGLIFREAIEIFLRLLNGEVISSEEITNPSMSRDLFRSDEDWDRVCRIAGGEPQINRRWVFDRLGVIPKDVRQELLRLTIGAHDFASHAHANQFRPVGVFNLSITPERIIEETHAHMQKIYHPSGGPWARSLMPRTVLVFWDQNRKRAHERAERAVAAYWKAMEGTLDSKKVEQAVGNALAGDTAEIAEQLKARFHPDDRLMLWFDFFSHDNEHIKRSMREIFALV